MLFKFNYRNLSYEWFEGKLKAKVYNNKSGKITSIKEQLIKFRYPGCYHSNA